MCESLAFFPSLDPSCVFGIYQVLLHSSQIEQCLVAATRLHLETHLIYFLYFFILYVY